MDIVLKAKKHNCKTLSITLAEKEKWLLAYGLKLDTQRKVQKFLQKEFEADLESMSVAQVTYEYENCIDSVIEQNVGLRAYIMLLQGQGSYELVESLNRVMETQYIYVPESLRSKGEPLTTA